MSSGGVGADVAVVLGTRPEIIKLAPLIRLFGPRARVIHSGQHYDRALASAFFDAFDLPPPSVELHIGGQSRGAQIGRAVAALDEVFDDEPPQVVIVQGDTNTTLAGALAANSRQVHLVHVEAGLRSHDRRMPEEHNRVLTDHLSDLLCAPTAIAFENAVAEGIPAERVAITGNTVVEAVEHMMPDPETRVGLVNKYGVRPGKFVLATFHRPENVDDANTLQSIIDALGQLGLPVLLPLHPRTRARSTGDQLARALDKLIVVDPVGYSEFLGLSSESAFLISDSGGAQEEASVYRKPIVVVRRSTERPEVLGTFARLVSPEDIPETVATWLHDPSAIGEQLSEMSSPYGDGTASNQIRNEIAKRFDL